MDRRKIKLAVISDVHLGTYGCRADALLHYLMEIEPEILVLNGDIIDIWQFSKSYFPKSHMKVVRRILKMAMNGCRVYYLTGNHDEMLRKFSGMEFGNIRVLNKLELELDGVRTLFFHGDVFDFSIRHVRWLAKLGGKAYDLLILLNTFVNFLSAKLGGRPWSLSAVIKNRVKQALVYIDSFETTAAEFAASQGAGLVVCGHIHMPADRVMQTGSGALRYLNSGDWVENMTALEYENGNWVLYRHVEKPLAGFAEEAEGAEGQGLLKEFGLV